MLAKRKSTVLALAALAVSGLASLPAAASSHREAPAISNDPAADNTDVWAWVDTRTHDKLVIVASYIPLEEPAGGMSGPVHRTAQGRRGVSILAGVRRCAALRGRGPHR